MTDKWISGFDPEYLDAAATCCRALNLDTVDGAARSRYFQLRLGYSHYKLYTTLASKLAREIPAAPMVVGAGGAVNTLGLSALQYLYMDVGCWTGDGSPGWRKHREFGVVYGHIAILCAYGEEPQYFPNRTQWRYFSDAHNNSIDPTVKNHPDFPRLEALFDALSSTLGTGDRRNLKILAAAAVSSRFIPAPQARTAGTIDPIYVFIGDLHAPVADSRANTHIIEGGTERLKGRLELRPPRLVEAAGLPAVAAWMNEQLDRDMDFAAETTAESANLWVDKYHVPGGKGAEIFQNAGQDLRSFVDALQNFHESTWPLEVVQLGDFFDLWIGFQRAYTGDITKPGAFHACAAEFTQLWIGRTLFDEWQGDHLTHFLTMGQRAGMSREGNAPLRTSFLYGNHDNYRRPSGMAFAVPAGREHAGLQINVFGAPDRLVQEGLWAEHGHQCDSSNSDASSTRGQKATQFAYLETSIRSLEGFATWMLAVPWQGEVNQIPRTVTIRRAMDLCLLNHINSADPCRGIYVMGHSHEPMLKRVELLPCPPSGT